MLLMIASILGIIGAFFVAKRNVFGFYVWIVGNGIWLYKFNYSWVGLMFFVYTILSIYSIWEWRKLR